MTILLPVGLGIVIRSFFPKVADTIGPALAKVGGIVFLVLVPFVVVMTSGLLLKMAGEHQVRMEFAYAGGGLGKGGKVTLCVDGKKDGEGDVGATLAMIFSADDGCDIGKDGGTAVSPDYKSGDNAFNGKVKGVQLAIADAAENSDHMVKPEDAIRMAMARQ